jgi:hypothetical protein
MMIQLSSPELRLLACLGERSEGGGQRTGLDPKLLARLLRINPCELAKGCTALAGHGLAGARAVQSESDKPDAGRISSIWITGRGEDYLQRLADDPAVRVQITVDLVKQMGEALTDIAFRVLTDFPRHPPARTQT